MSSALNRKIFRPVIRIWKQYYEMTNKKKTSLRRDVAVRQLYLFFDLPCNTWRSARSDPSDSSFQAPTLKDLAPVAARSRRPALVSPTWYLHFCKNLPFKYQGYLKSRSRAISSCSLTAEGTAIAIRPIRYSMGRV